MTQARVVLPVLTIFFSPVASAEVYTWREPQSGVQRVSNVAPGWYRPYARVIGPRVVVTLDRAVIDDTAWPLVERLEVERRRRSRSAPRR
jgi:hypothetical protein